MSEPGDAATDGPQIGLLRERSLHADLKAWAARPGDRLETAVDGFVVDIVRGGRLLEVQTGNFSALKRKLSRLLPSYDVEIIHPIAQDKWIVRQTAAGEPVSRRRSPRHGRFIDLFAELVRIHPFLDHPRLTLTAVLTQEEEIWRDDGRGSWRRRRWSVADRRLLAVVDQRRFAGVADLTDLVPAGLAAPFSNADLADALGCRRALAQKITYTLRHCGGLVGDGRRGRARLYRRAGADP